jgi:hypothetical protein
MLIYVPMLLCGKKINPYFSPMKPLCLIIIFLFLTILSCKPDSGDPAAVAREFVAATNESRFADARKMATANYQPVLDRLEKNLAAMPKEQREKLQQNVLQHSQQYKVMEKTGDSAEVLVSSESSPVSTIFTLKREKGKWLIERQEDVF